MGVVKPASIDPSLREPPDTETPVREEVGPVRSTAHMEISYATKDLAQALKSWRIWALLGANDIRQRYRRSTLGQFWITASITLLILGLGIIYSAIFQQPIQEYLPYVAIGFVVWSLITGMVNEGCITFLEAEVYAKQLTIPLSAYVLRTLFRNLFTFGHNLLIVPFVWVIFLVPIGWSCLLAIPGIFLIV